MMHWTDEGNPTPIEFDGKALYFDGEKADAERVFKNFADDHHIYGDGIFVLEVSDDKIDDTYIELPPDGKVKAPVESM